MGTPRLDLTPLTEPVTAEEVRRHRREAAARGEAPGGRALLVRLGVPAVSAVGAVVAVVIFALMGRSGWSMGVAVLVAAFAMVSAVRAVAANRRAWAAWAVLERFAARNGLRFVPEYPAPADPAQQLLRGKQRRRTEWFRFPGDRIQVANHRYVITSGGGEARSSSVYHVGVVAVRLGQGGSRLVIDAVQHDRHRRATGAKAPRGELERVVLQRADFDQPYRLYLQAGAQQEAMRPLTTRLVDALVAAAAEGAPWDVEAVGGTAFLMQPEFLELEDPATWRRVMRVADAVG